MKSMPDRKGKVDGLGHSRGQAVAMVLLFAFLPLEEGKVTVKQSSAYISNLGGVALQVVTIPREYLWEWMTEVERQITEDERKVSTLAAMLLDRQPTWLSPKLIKAWV